MSLHHVTWTETAKYADVLDLPDDWHALDEGQRGDCIAESVVNMDEACLTCEEREVEKVTPVTAGDAALYRHLEAITHAENRLRAERAATRQRYVAELRDAVESWKQASTDAEVDGDWHYADRMEEEIPHIAARLLPYL